ncbi:response regulator [Aurantibacillus circumpalustris]|uniref:response regulator n=1 Tax=Aurantibacillus circumpalustris TaxID=3036359 RepID=UPI00295AA1B3|nr:response regulator [Aurantibacillus circumpalustris]
MKTILIIEDNNDVRENTAEILELANYKVLQAENGKIGVELAQKMKPDLIICDIMMPVLDGYGVIHLLNKSQETASIPFIFLTAKTERLDFRKGMEMGADDYISKPFDDIELLNAIESRLKKAEILKAEFSKNVEGLNKFFEEVRKVDDLKKLSTDRRIKTYKKKDVIYSEGNDPVYLFFLSKGKVKLTRSHEYGKELITTLYKEGDFFGYTSLLEGGAYAENAEAMDDCEVCLIPKEDFLSLMYNNMGVMKIFIKMLSDNIAEKEKQLVNLAYSSVRKRVADALVKLQERFEQDKDKNFSISISREDLANMVGTATESLIRTLSDFKHDQLIEIKGSSITILNRTKLANLKA